MENDLKKDIICNKRKSLLSQILSFFDFWNFKEGFLQKSNFFSIDKSALADREKNKNPDPKFLVFIFYHR